MSGIGGQIPEFEEREGYLYLVLPEGVYPCDETTFRHRFADAFLHSRTRTPICAGFFRLRSEAAGLSLAATQWVDGSFVESKLDPEDIDVVSFVDYDQLVALPPGIQEQVGQLLAGQAATKAVYHSHTFLVASCPAGHPYAEVFQAARRYWRAWWGRTRCLPEPAAAQLGYGKGFVVMTLLDAALAPVISTERD